MLSPLPPGACPSCPGGPGWCCPARIAEGSCGARTGWLRRRSVGAGCKESPWDLPTFLGAVLTSALSLSVYHIMAMLYLVITFLPAWLPGQALSWARPYDLLAAAGPCATTPGWVLQGQGLAILLPTTWTLSKHWLTYYTHFHASKEHHMKSLFSQACDCLQARDASVQFTLR